MPTLEQDEIVFRFPKIEEEARFRINFQRTLRIPDTDVTYSLPPGLSPFPVRHVEDYATNLPPATTARGGVILPMWQAEAMWLAFSNWSLGLPLDFPVAIKIAAGKINAVTGELCHATPSPRGRAPSSRPIATPVSEPSSNSPSARPSMSFGSER